MAPKITMMYTNGLVFISSGVSNDGGGIIITANGKIIHIPPWTGPISEKEVAVCYQKIVSGLNEMEALISSSR